jgi:hypothetical protein
MDDRPATYQVCPAGAQSASVLKICPKYRQIYHRLTSSRVKFTFPSSWRRQDASKPRQERRQPPFVVFRPLSLAGGQ